MNLDPALLQIIVCPACRSDLEVQAEELVCTGCGLAYPVRDDIPVLLVDEARKPG
ncbi:MAG: Trm112 family protein [Nocardioides sp.]|nr:Trm112 family protein [Nocardioides sp.]